MITREEYCRWFSVRWLINVKKKNCSVSGRNRNYYINFNYPELPNIRFRPIYGYIDRIIKFYYSLQMGWSFLIVNIFIPEQCILLSKSEVRCLSVLTMVRSFSSIMYKFKVSLKRLRKERRDGSEEEKKCSKLGHSSVGSIAYSWCMLIHTFSPRRYAAGWAGANYKIFKWSSGVLTQMRLGCKSCMRLRVYGNIQTHVHVYKYIWILHI